MDTQIDHAHMGHLISTCQLPKPLASITAPTHGVGIFEK